MKHTFGDLSISNAWIILNCFCNLQKYGSFYGMYVCTMIWFSTWSLHKQFIPRSQIFDHPTTEMIIMSEMFQYQLENAISIALCDASLVIFYIDGPIHVFQVNHGQAVKKALSRNQFACELHHLVVVSEHCYNLGEKDRAIHARKRVPSVRRSRERWTLAF
jgi:hypothetical protein